MSYEGVLSSLPQSSLPFNPNFSFSFQAAAHAAAHAVEFNSLPSSLPMDFQAEGVVRADREIRDPHVPRYYVARCISNTWYDLVEFKERDNAVVGDRFLVRRLDRDMMVNGANVTFRTDYITERIEQPTCYGNWSHCVVIYPAEGESPFPATHDCFTEREAYFGWPLPPL